MTSLAATSVRSGADYDRAGPQWPGAPATLVGGRKDRLALVGGLSADRKARCRPRFPDRLVRPVEKELKNLRLSSGFGHLIRMDNCVC